MTPAAYNKQMTNQNIKRTTEIKSQSGSPIDSTLLWVETTVHSFWPSGPKKEPNVSKVQQDWGQLNREDCSRYYNGKSMDSWILAGDISLSKD